MSSTRREDNGSVLYNRFRRLPFCLGTCPEQRSGCLASFYRGRPYIDLSPAVGTVVLIFKDIFVLLN